MTSDCPICMETLTVGEHLYCLPCTTCDSYNFCTTCVDEFIRSSKDDYQEASDGSQQVKVHIACPQCRSKYPMDLQDILLLRRAHALASIVYNSETGTMLDDSEMSASQLVQKRDFGGSHKTVELAHATFCKVFENKMDAERDLGLVKAKLEWGRLLPPSDDDDDDDDDNLDGSKNNKKKNKNKNKKSMPENVVDTTLFMGLEDCMGKDEQAFVTSFLTSGDEEKLNQAAMILNGILKMDSAAIQKFNLQAFERNEKMKKSFPLPNHMPNYFSNIATYNPKQKRFLNLTNLSTDNIKMTPPQKMARVWDKIYDDYVPSTQNNKQNRVCIQGVRGPMGKLGIRRNDIITHINDMTWNGTAEELNDYILNLHEQDPNSEFTMTVNANMETAKFLQYRHRMVLKSRIELL